jgi:hypothetical protein
VTEVVLIVIANLSGLYFGFRMGQLVGRDDD